MAGEDGGERKRGREKMKYRWNVNFSEIYKEEGKPLKLDVEIVASDYI